MDKRGDRGEVPPRHRARAKLYISLGLW